MTVVAGAVVATVATAGLAAPVVTAPALSGMVAGSASAASAAGAATAGAAAGTAAGTAAGASTAGITAGIVSGPVGWLLLGAEQDIADPAGAYITFDCWKAVLRDLSFERSIGKFLWEMFEDQRIKEINVRETGNNSWNLPELSLVNIWDEIFDINYLVLPTSNQLVAHAVRVATGASTAADGVAGSTAGIASDPVGWIVLGAEDTQQHPVDYFSFHSYNTFDSWIGLPNNKFNLPELRLVNIWDEQFDINYLVLSASNQQLVAHAVRVMA